MKYFLLIAAVIVVSCNTKSVKQENSLNDVKKELAIKRAELEALQVDKSVNQLTGKR